MNNAKIKPPQNMKIGIYNDNRIFKIFSCWRNKIITRNGQKVYATMKGHFPYLAFLEF